MIYLKYVGMDCWGREIFVDAENIKYVNVAICGGEKNIFALGYALLHEDGVWEGEPDYPIREEWRIVEEFVQE